MALQAPIPIDVEQTRDWVDPVFGILLHTPDEDRWHAALMADIGGFGVGSDFAWHLFPSAGFDVTNSLSLGLGWRIMDTDYETGADDNRFATDVRLQGPTLGLLYRF